MSKTLSQQHAEEEDRLIPLQPGLTAQPTTSDFCSAPERLNTSDLRPKHLGDRHGAASLYWIGQDEDSGAPKRGHFLAHFLSSYLTGPVWDPS